MTNKTMTSVYVDADLKRNVQDKGYSLSELLNRAMSSVLDEKSMLNSREIELEKQVEHLKNEIIEVQRAKQKANDEDVEEIRKIQAEREILRKQIKDKEMEKTNLLIEKIDGLDFPEKEDWFLSEKPANFANKDDPVTALWFHVLEKIRSFDINIGLSQMVDVWDIKKIGGIENENREESVRS